MCDKDKIIKCLDALDKNLVKKLIEDANTISSINFEMVLGNTLAQKLTSCYVKLREVTNVMIRKGSVGYFFLVLSPELATMFETASNFILEDDLWICQGSTEIYLLGRLGYYYRCYVDPLIEADQLLVGCINANKEITSGTIKFEKYIRG